MNNWYTILILTSFIFCVSFSGSSEGDVSIISADKMTVHQKVRGAHMIFVTSMEFSRDCRSDNVF